jgi:hypothetical protein
MLLFFALLLLMLRLLLLRFGLKGLLTVSVLVCSGGGDCGVL